jgi:hypothetical protein
VITVIDIDVSGRGQFFGIRIWFFYLHIIFVTFVLGISAGFVRLAFVFVSFAASAPIAMIYS